VGDPLGFSVTRAVIPRLVNAVCDKALLAGFVDGTDLLTWKQVRRAIRELEGELHMSLISDALKKARQEAARQDSLRQTLPYAVGAADPVERRNQYMPLLAGLGRRLRFSPQWCFGIVYPWRLGSLRTGAEGQRFRSLRLRRRSRLQARPSSSEAPLLRRRWSRREVRLRPPTPVPTPAPPALGSGAPRCLSPGRLRRKKNPAWWPRHRLPGLSPL